MSPHPPHDRPAEDAEGLGVEGFDEEGRGVRVGGEAADGVEGGEEEVFGAPDGRGDVAEVAGAVVDRVAEGVAAAAPFVGVEGEVVGGGFAAAGQVEEARAERAILKRRLRRSWPTGRLHDLEPPFMAENRRS